MPSWNLDLGPISISSKGVQAKPQCLLGGHCGNFHTSTGVGDVREGLKLIAEADMRQDFSARGDSLGEFLKELKASDGLADDLLNPVISKLDAVTSLVLEMLGVDISGRCRVEGSLTLKVGVGLGAHVALGWQDPDGFYMVGAGGNAAAGLHLSFAVFAGLKTEPRPAGYAALGLDHEGSAGLDPDPRPGGSRWQPREVKLVFDAGNFGIKAMVSLPVGDEASIYRASHLSDPKSRRSGSGARHESSRDR